MNIDQLLALVPDENRDEAAELLKNLRNSRIRGAISQVLCRNLSHGVPEKILLQKKSK